MAKVKFTAGRVDSFQCLSEKSSSFLWDSVMPGLGLRVTPNGAKAYIFQGKLKGQVIRITIGSPAAWDITSAQKEAARLRVIINNGHDPRQIKIDDLASAQAERDRNTAAEAAAEAERELLEQRTGIARTQQTLLARSAWDDYLKAPHPKWGVQHRADHVVAGSAGGAKPKIGKKETKAAPLASLLNKPLFAITAEVVHEWLITECATRPTFAHNSFRKFRTFIKWCSKHPEFRDLTHADCCLTDDVRDIVPPNKTKEGDSLQREQLAAWFDAVRKLSNPVISAYLQGLLITGARREELAGLCWEHVDFKWRSLTIHDKVEGHRIIPLSPYLSSILADLPRRNKWVFSSPAAASGRLTEPRIAHTRALAAAGLPHVSLHGLRRSFGTLCEWVEMPSGISAQIMGHKPSALAEKHYRRRPIDLLRKWHDQVETWMLAQAAISFPQKSALGTVERNTNDS
jgi:integrase